MTINWPDVKLPPINLWNAPRAASRKTLWSCKGQVIYVTRGECTASVACPVDGYYTHARAWNELFKRALWLAETRLWLEEYRRRM